MKHGVEEKTCPHCDAPLQGLGTFCHECNRYTTDPRPRPDAEAPKLSEKEIQASIVRYLDAVGCDVVDTSQPRATMITEGLSDLIVFHDGRCVFAECKRPGKEPTAHQNRFRTWCERAGQTYEVWTSVDDAQCWFQGAEEDVA